MKPSYYCNCVSWPQDDVNEPGGLCDMVENGRPITRQTFCRNVDQEARQFVEHELLGYPMGALKISRDYAVSYERGNLHGQAAYWINHSAIEYVFV